KININNFILLFFYDILCLGVKYWKKSKKYERRISYEFYQKERSRSSALSRHRSTVMVSRPGGPGDRRTCLRDPDRHGHHIGAGKERSLCPGDQLYIKKDPPSCCGIPWIRNEPDRDP